MKLHIFTISILLLLSLSSVFSQPLHFSPAQTSINLTPISSPSEIPSNPPSQSPLISSPVSSPVISLWCVAKQSAPAGKLQEAMDFACGTGGVICEDILQGGPCFYPNSILDHASFAFNSYWQFAKGEGGNCDFDGAAVVVSSDPSFEGCHFVLI